MWILLVGYFDHHDDQLLVAQVFVSVAQIPYAARIVYSRILESETVLGRVVYFDTLDECFGNLISDGWIPMQNHGEVE